MLNSSSSPHHIRAIKEFEAYLNALQHASRELDTDEKLPSKKLLQNTRKYLKDFDNKSGLILAYEGCAEFCNEIEIVKSIIKKTSILGALKSLIIDYKVISKRPQTYEDFEVRAVYLARISSISEDIDNIHGRISSAFQKRCQPPTLRRVS